MKTFLASGIITRQWGNEGKIGSGFKIYFYQSQTDTKQTIYSDVDGLIPHENPVTCNASGYMGAIYGRGIYRVVITDSFGQQVVPPIDGFGADIGVDGGATYFFCQTYDELRAITADYDFAYVCGRTEVGDGGQGLFQRIPETQPDDDGIIITNSAGNVVWKRVFSGFIDPQWYGLKYDAILSQSAPLEKSMLASYRFHIPVRFTGHIYIDQSIEFVEGSAFVADEGAVVTSTYSNSILVSGESDIHGRFFGENVRAEFAARYSKIKISWFGGQTDDARLVKLYQSASTDSQILVIDETLNISSDINIGQPITFEGGVINLASPALNLLLFKFIEPSYIGKIFNISTTLSAINLGGKFILPEYFGAVGNGYTNDSVAFGLAAKTGFVKVIDGKTYKLSTQLTMPVSLSVIGSATLSIGANNLNCTSLTLNECSVSNTGTGEWFNGTYLFATNCVIPENYVVSSTKVISGCAYQGNPLYPVFDGDTGPAIYKAHLPLLVNSPGLATDDNGKIISNGSWWNRGRDWTVSYVEDLTGKRIFGLRYLQGKFHAVGDDGYYATSTDGITWTQLGIGTTQWLGDICWTGTKYVIVGNSVLANSVDGITWTLRSLPPDYVGTSAGFTYCCTSGTSVITSEGTYGRCIRSVDNGDTWAMTISADTSIGSLNYYANNRYILASTAGYIRYSDNDGANWGLATYPAGMSQTTACYSPTLNRWVVGGYSNSKLAFVYTTDPASGNWGTCVIDGPSGATQSVENIVWAGGQFTAACRNGIIATSTNGIYWTLRRSSVNVDLWSIAAKEGPREVNMIVGGTGRLFLRAE